MVPVDVGTKRIRNLSQDFWGFLRGSPHRLLTYFIHGLIMMIPLAVTIWLIVWLFNLFDGMLAPILVWGFGRPMPGMGLAIIIFSFTLIGYIGVKFGHRKAFGFFEGRMIKIPILGAIYGGTKQVLTSFTTSSNSKFLKVVFMEFPRKGIYTVGLVTNEVKDKNGTNILNVYIPTVPNPTSGFLQIVKESDVIKTSMSISDALKLVISAGKISLKEIGDAPFQVQKLESKGEEFKL